MNLSTSQNEQYEFIAYGIFKYFAQTKNQQKYYNTNAKNLLLTFTKHKFLTQQN